MTATQTVAVVAVVAVLVVAVFFPPRVIAGQNGVRVNPEGYCKGQVSSLDQRIAEYENSSAAQSSSGQTQPSNPFARPFAYDLRGERERTYDACVNQSVVDAPLLAVYIAGVLGTAALLAWVIPDRSKRTA